MSVTNLAFAIFLGLFAERWLTEGLKTLLYMYAAKRYQQKLEKGMKEYLLNRPSIEAENPLTLN